MMMVKIRQYIGAGWTDWITCFMDARVYELIKSKHPKWQVVIVW